MDFSVPCDSSTRGMTRGADALNLESLESSIRTDVTGWLAWPTALGYDSGTRVGKPRDHEPNLALYSQQLAETTDTRNFWATKTAARTLGKSQGIKVQLFLI